MKKLALILAACLLLLPFAACNSDEEDYTISPTVFPEGVVPIEFDENNEAYLSAGDGGALYPDGLGDGAGDCYVYFYDDGLVSVHDSNGADREGAYEVNGATVTIDLDGQLSELTILNRRVLQSDESNRFLRMT